MVESLASISMWDIISATFYQSLATCMYFKYNPRQTRLINNEKIKGWCLGPLLSTDIHRLQSKSDNIYREQKSICGEHLAGDLAGRYTKGMFET